MSTNASHPEEEIRRHGPQPHQRHAPQQQHQGASTRTPTGAATAWWWAAGIATLICLALIAWIVVLTSARFLDQPPPTPITVSATTPGAHPSWDPTTPGVDDDIWGPYPPLNIDALRDLSQLNFPEQVQTYTLKSETPHFVAPMARYDDSAAGVAMSITVLLSPYEYAKVVSHWDSPTYVGGALCGHPSNAPGHTHCVMAGEDQTLKVGTAAPDVTMENVSAFIEDLYEQL